MSQGQEQTWKKPRKAINPLIRWVEADPEKLHIYSLGKLNSLGILEEMFQGVEFDLLAKKPEESIKFTQKILDKIQELKKEAEMSGDEIAMKIARQHRNNDYVDRVESSPHFGVIWFDAEWHEIEGEFIDLYWMIGQVFNDTKKIVKLPPVTRAEINKLKSELVKVRYNEKTLKSWWNEIDNWVEKTDLLYVTQENGIWKLYQNSKSRELFNQDFNWIHSEILSRINLVARGRIKAKEVWLWLDSEEKELAKNCERIINNKKIRLKYQVLDSGTLKWLVYWNGTNYHIKRYELQKVRENILKGTWQPPNK